MNSTCSQFHIFAFLLCFSPPMHDHTHRCQATSQISSTPCSDVARARKSTPITHATCSLPSRAQDCRWDNNYFNTSLCNYGLESTGPSIEMALECKQWHPLVCKIFSLPFERSQKSRKILANETV